MIAVTLPPRCACGECVTLDRAHPTEGWQMILPVVVPIRSGGRPDAAPLTDPDAPAVPAADVSKRQAAQSRRKLAAAKAGDRPAMTATAALAKPARTAKPAPARPARAPKPAAAATPAPAEAPAVAAPPTVIPSAPQLVPLDRLRRSPENVRHTRIAEDVDGLADDIAAHGLLQNLIGYSGEWPEDEGRVFIVGGGRRLQALNALRERGAIGADFAVPVLIREYDEAIELSLAENLQQRTMSPVDEFAAFKLLMDKGSYSPATLALRFGWEERKVKQRLRLADLAEPVLDALAKRDITLDAAMAYAATQDRDLQTEVFKVQARRGWEPHRVGDIRHALKMKGVRTDDPLFVFVGASAYEYRGGGYEDDLFLEQSDQARTLADPYKLHTAVADAIDLLMVVRLPEFQWRKELATTIAGHVIAADQRVRHWGGANKHAAPKGMVQVDSYETEKMWALIRRNAVNVHVLVGIDDKGELTVQPRTVFVAKGDAAKIKPPTPSYGYTPPDPVEEAKRVRERAVELWSRRLAVGPFADTPLDGRAYWPEPYHDRGTAMVREGVNGRLVSIDIFVADEEIAAAHPAAVKRYEDGLAAKAEQEQAEARAKLVGDLKRERFLAMDPCPAVVVIDGQAWFRDEDGRYAPEGDDDDPADSWADLIEGVAPEDLDDTYDTTADYAAAMAGGDA